MCKDEIRTILEQHLMLLSEVSKKEPDMCGLAAITNSLLDTATMILAFE